MILLALALTVSQLCSSTWYASPPQTDAPCVVDGVAIYLASAPEPKCDPGKMVEGASIESMVVAQYAPCHVCDEEYAGTVGRDRTSGEDCPACQLVWDYDAALQWSSRPSPLQSVYGCSRCGWFAQFPGRVSMEVVVDEHFRATGAFHGSDINCIGE